MNVPSPLPRRSARDLIDAIGEIATIALAEEFGGTRLYVPLRVPDHHQIARAVGQEAAQALCQHCGPGTIRVPLARELRAKHYRAEGLSFARIAVRLGVTEGGVRALFKRIEEKEAI